MRHGFCFDFVRSNGGEGGSFETERPMSRGWKNFGRRWTGGLKILVIFMDVICLSSPREKIFLNSSVFKRSDNRSKSITV